MMKSTKKKLIKRSVSFLTALVMSFGYVASPDLVNEVKDGVTRTTSFLRAYAAADNPYFKKWDDLQAYAEAYTADNQNDTIYIQCNAGMDIPSDFVGIGTSDAPFKGQIIIQNVSDDNGGDSARIHLNSPLFNYISDEATITDTNNNNCTLYLYPDTMGDRPLFARYVAGTGGSANWKIKVNEVADVDNNSSQINARSSLIGEIYNKTAEPDITISYYNQFAEISGNDNLGVICNTLRDGKLTVSFPEDADGINVPSITTTNGNVGGIVGEMGSGTELKINSTINMTSSRIISTGDGYAGGLVGKCLGTVEFDTDTSYSDNNSTSITGSSAAGGVFGYFEVDDDILINISDYCLTTVQDANAPGEGIKATSANSAVGGFIGKLVNNGTDDNVVSITITGGDSIAESPTINSTLSATESESNGGGLIGLYYTESLKNSLLIDHINLTSGGIKVGKYYGGIIGKTESNYNCGAYVRINDVTVNSNYFHSIDQYKLNTRSSGLVCSMENDFIDISGLVTLTGRVHAGIIFDSPSGVVRLAGTTDLSGLTIDNGMLVTNRNNTLIYALGSGSDYDSENQTGWTYKRTGVANATALDDINPWGQVVRYVSTTVGDTTNSETIEAASVVDVDATNHTVTLQDASLNMASSADFAKTALNIQLNTTGEDFGALQFASDSNTSSSLLEDELTISNSFNLAGTGITGLTRDNEGSESINGSLPFTGALISSGNNTITLAIGEAYGYKGSALAVSVPAGDGNKNTGAIIDHTLNGLFAKLGNCTIGTSGNSLTLNGNIIASSASTHYIGGLAAQLYDGTVTINNIKCKETIDVNGGGTKRIGMLIGEVLRTTHKETINNAETTVIDGEPISLSIDTLEMAGTVNVVSTKACVGLIGRISDPTLDATFDNVTLKGTIDYTGADRPYAGGLIGATSTTTGYSRNVTLNNVNVNGLSVSTNMTGNSSISNKFENPAGGLLGGQWLNTNVIWGSKTDTDKSVKITSGTLDLSGNSSFAGGLVANATGYWQVNDIDVTAMTITGANDGIGILVLNGKNTTDNATYGLYLEMTSLGAYSLPNDFKVTDDAPAVAYDEVMAFSKGISTITKKVEGTDTTVIVPSESNGQAIISIHTSNIDGVPKLSMDNNTDNSYSPKSTLGATHNPFARYYYNLDYLLPNASTGGEKLLLWSVYQYATGNIKNNSKIQSEHVGSNNTTYGFSSYNTFPAANSTCDLASLSYYPVDISDTVTISSGITVKFYNSEMQAAHGNTYDLNGVGSKSNNSQHYLMHAGLFKDIKRSLTINSMTLQGNISSHGISDAEDLAAGSGAIACGTVQGSTGSIINVRIDDLTLDGIMVNMNSGIDALMVEKVGGNVAFTIKDVKTSSSGYSSYSASDYAANYLIGDAEGSSMTFNFSEMILDGRTTDNSSTIYNPSATSGTAKELNDAYHTSKSIFKEATFFKSLKYAKGSGSSAKYNYDWSEDWGTTKHQVTYGKEISETAENIKVISGNNVSQQTRYADRKASSGGLEYYTSPESDSLTSAPYDFSDFIPHVKEPYDKDNNYHEVAINLVNAVIESGCGTYNDPYIIDDGERLETIAKALNDTTDTSGFSKGFYLFINAEYANLGTKINYFSKGDNKDKDRWCDAGEDYKFVYDDAQSDKTKKFVYTYVENGTTKYKYLSVQDVKNYLAGAYYYIDGNITLSSSFVGLGGNSTTNAFRGVIVGGQITDGENTSYPIITNNSEFPLVKKSNGSVIKNVTIHIAPEDDISLTANTKNAFAYSEDSNSVQYYGGVIGEIMGGDNIIDNVPVIFQNNKNVIIDDSTAYFNDIPVGAYVGVIVNGSLMFRKMTSDMTSTDTTGFHAYLSSDTSKSITLESDVQFNQDGTETITNLYVNPIIGRVLNGFAINETDTYRYSEDGYYVDRYSAERTTARASVDKQVTLKNGRKNFSIPDFNSESFEEIGFSKSDEALALGTSQYNDIITIKDAQSLYILSLICQTNMGSASTDGDVYGLNQESGYDTNNRIYYKATHLASYDNVKVSGLTKNDLDFAKTKYELAYSRKEVPYLIFNYTPGTPSNGKFAARTLTTGTRKYNIVLDTNDTLYLPDSFRGIGYLGADNSGYMTIKTFDGNNNYVDVNTYFRSYSSSIDNQYGTRNYGIALFNAAKQDVISVSNGIPADDSKAFKDFTIKGCISAKRVDSDNTLITGYANSTTAYWRVGGVISYDGNSQVYNFDDVDFEDLNLDGTYNVGALVAAVVNNTDIYANNCDAANLKVTGTRQLGSMVGLSAGADYFFNTKDNASSTLKINIHELPTDDATALHVGGMLGEHTNGNLIIKNVDIVGWNGSFNSNSTKKPYIGRDYANGEAIDQGSSTDGTSLYVGGVIGKIAGASNVFTNNVIDNVNVYGLNIYGYAVGGIVGGATHDNGNYHIVNCGIHGIGNENVPIISDTYELCGAFETGGIMGYSHNPCKPGNESNNLSTFSINDVAYSQGYIGGAYVNNYTIKQTKTGNALCSVGGIIGIARNKKNISDSKVANCTFSSYGGNQTKMGGIVGEFTKYNLYGYNLSVINNNFDPILNNGENYAQYGLTVGGVNTNNSANDRVYQIMISGFTSYGNTVNAPFGKTSNSTMLTGNRNVEFVYGRPYDYNKANGFYNNNFNTTYTNNYLDSKKDAISPKSYIIYSDYLHESIGNTAGTVQSRVNNANNVPMLNGSSFPYVISSPYAAIGSGTLTGDGIYMEIGEDDSIAVMADKIIKDRETAIPSNGTETYDATVYKNFTDTDLKVYKALKASGKISSFNKQAGKTVLTSDIPMIVLDDTSFSVTVDGTSYGYSDIIKSYIRILSNSNYRFDNKSTDLEDQIYNIEILKCRYSNSTFAEPTSEDATLQFSNGNFVMTNSYDSSVDGQFTVIDVQFYDPASYSTSASKRTKVAYHLYIPVYTKKAFNFKFHATALSGTTYDKSAYDDGMDTVVENYGSPVTMFIRYEYSVSDIINDVLAGKYGLDWNYDKTLDLIYNFPKNGSLPSKTRFVLIDANQNDKTNYATVPDTNGDLSINPIVFSGYSIDENEPGDEAHYSYSAFSVIHFDKLLEKNGISLSVNALSASNINTTTEPIFISVDADAEREGKFAVSGLTLAVASQDEKDAAATDSNIKLYTVSANGGDTVYEDYYLTVYAPADSGDVRHQVTFKSMENLSCDNKIKATCKKADNDDVLLVFANIFDKDTVVKTMEGEGDISDKLISLEAKDTIQIQAISTIKFDETKLGTQLNEVIGILNGSQVKVYHSTQLQFKRNDTDSSTTIAVDGTQFSLTAPGGGYYLSNNSGVYVKMPDGYTGEDSYFTDVDTEHIHPYKQVVNCYGNNALDGKRVANFYEVINKTSEGNYIDLRPYLTGAANGLNNIASEVSIVTNFTMKFTANGIAVQFAERPKDDGTEGTEISGQSSLAYSQAGTTYGKNKTTLLSAQPTGRKYYRKALSKTTLSFEVWNSDELSDVGAKNKSNNSLGINPYPYLGYQDIEDDKASISTMGEYDAMQLSGASEANNVTWTLELYSRQKKIVNGVETGEEYGEKLPINEYLTNIKVYGITPNTTSRNEVALSSTSSTNTTLTYKYPRGNFEDMTVKINADDTTTNKFIVYVDFDVITGESFEEDNVVQRFYSNYKVVLTAKLDDDATSKATNHIIYTNAKLDPSFIDTN